ncbi:MAG: hypothetical protein QOE20_4884 [Mycobacterium sp.]|nr:hypothetical protein [Mycobacterium sp.]
MSVRELLRANDARFIGLAHELDATEWSAPSLCDEWTNHEVLAHLVFGYGGRLGVLVAEMCRHRGSFDDANTDLARTLAATRSPAALLEDFARLVATDEAWVAWSRGATGCRPRQRTRFGAGQPAEGAVAVERRRGGRAGRPGAQPPEPYGLVMISR